MNRLFLHDGLLSAPSWRTVIGVAGEPVSAAFELTVEVVQQHVGEQREKRRALRGSNLAGLDAVPDQDTRPPVAPDDGEQTSVAHPPRDASHQDVVRNAIEELLQIEIDGEPRAGDDMALHLTSVRSRLELPPSALPEAER